MTPALAHENDLCARERGFDSIVCFGGVDWWYHNRGHFDLQMMREFSKELPVLYVNSIGMRFPQLSEGVVFAKRIRRKLSSMRRGVVRVSESFSVYSPFCIPGRFGRAPSAALLAFQVRRAMAELGFAKPLIWVNNPMAWDALGHIPHSALVYNRTDRYEDFPSADPSQVRVVDQLFKASADLTLYCADSLMGEPGEGDACHSAAFVDHGVDYESFLTGAEGPDPEDLRDIPGPRIGFVGGIDSHTFDAPLFQQVVERMPDVHFVLVGGTTFGDGWLSAPNVHFLGRKPYAEVHRYSGRFDVLIMPWNRNPWIEVCNPVKLKEYLATGRPVVTTPFRELGRYEGYVRVAEGPEAFAEAIRGALAPESPEAGARRQQRVAGETWEAQSQRALTLLDGIEAQ